MIPFLWFAVTVLLVGGGALAFYLITRTNGTARKVDRDLEFKRARAVIESKQRRAIADKDLFGQYEAEKEILKLNDKYIAGEEHP